jgi:hypothetical protein
MKPQYDRKRVMKMAHKEWETAKHKRGWDFARCMRLAWKIEKKIASGPEYYQPRITAAHVISATGKSRDFIWL